MPIYHRFKYAFFASVIVIMLLGVIAILFSWDIIDFMSSGYVFVSVFIVFYVVAPILGKYIKLK